MSLGVVVLAAGLSSRMGRCKALLPWRNGTVLDAVLAAFTDLPMQSERILVVGRDRAAMDPIATRHGFCTVENPCPEDGQASSLRQGVAALGDVDGILCAVADQPLLEARYIRRMVDVFGKHGGNRQRIVCPQYGDTRGGNPVIFGASWREDLMKVTGDVGGRAIVRGKGKAYVSYCPLPAEVGCDLDTPEEYAKMYRLWGKL